MQLVENLVVAGRFRLNRLIGRGGMGSVWHATHLGLDIPCAVKFIEGEYAGLAEAQSRFEREAKAAAQLRSPHVVQILDHGVWESTPYIAMELLEGEDLGKRLTRLHTLPVAEINTIIQQVARALTKAHQAGIVHRDLKPDNIFLVRDDDREIVKVLDFGIAKKNTTGLDTGNNTKTGAMLGTPYYMSPEQAQGTKGVDWRSDLWSLAVIVYQMLTSKLPFESEALGDLLVKIIVAPIPVPSQVASVPAPFDRWWLRAADRDPTKRYQSAKELADALAMALGQSQVTDVMERGALGTAVLPGSPNQSPSMQTSPNANSPYMNTPNPQQTAMLATPNPAQPPMQQTPYPGQMLPAGLVPQAMGGGGISGNTTGAPLAKTYDGSAAGLPKKNNTGLIAALAGGFVVVAALATGLVALKHKPAPGAASAGTAASVVSTTVTLPPAADPVPPPADPASAAAAPGTGAATTATAPTPAVPTAPVPATPGAGAGAVAAGGATPRPATQPASKLPGAGAAKPAGSAKGTGAPKPAELGF